jgi:hypothetical protein
LDDLIVNVGNDSVSFRFHQCDCASLLPLTEVSDAFICNALMAKGVVDHRVKMEIERLFELSFFTNRFSIKSMIIVRIRPGIYVSQACVAAIAMLIMVSHAVSKRKAR